MRWWVAVLALLAASTARAEGPSAEDVAFFESRVRPLLIKHCFECHSAESKAIKGGLRLDTAEFLKQGGDSGEAVLPGKPEESLLIEALRFTGDVQMPPAGKLPEPEIATLEEWVRRGAIFPPSSAADSKGRRTVDIAAGKQLWSIRPFQMHPLPEVHDSAWPEQRMDSFVLSALEARGLRPSAQADRRTRIRRISFDVIGLPPSPDEVEAFVNDSSGDAWPRLVDRLLASPRYGERWGRYWLDLVRYCDVPESWARTDAQPWLYRDWVVQALNEDLPYDRFVSRQLAADQLPDFQPRDVAALGFLGLSPSYWKELKLAPDVIKTVVAEEWEERITAVTGTLLGLTVGCARCHDHKFDPVTQQDYYGLAGVFASIRQVPLPLLPRAEAKAVTEAHVEVQRLESEAERLKAVAGREKSDSQVERKKAEELRKTDPTNASVDELIKKADTLEAQSEESLKKSAEATAKAKELRTNTPNYSAALAYAVEDASLSVLPDGPDRTKLEYQVGAGQNVAMQVRGNPARTTDVIPRRYLSVLSPDTPGEFTQGSGRRELAEAIFRDSAPLAARVIVNRVWRHHFGRGLVDTPSNFGVQGSRPSHPELLDDLAARFIAAGWSLKWLHREILLSATYQQTSAVTDELKAIDPDNVLLGRMNRRRLDVEAWRDAMLAATNTLDPTMGGAAQDLAETGHVRRTIYGLVHRRELNDLLRLYDFPDPVAHSPARIDTTTPLQQLFVLNSEFLGRQASSLVASLHCDEPGDARTKVERAYAVLYGRPPTSREVDVAEEFLKSTGWKEYFEVLLARNEMMFVD